MVLERQKLSSHNEMLGGKQTTLTGLFQKQPRHAHRPPPHVSPQKKVHEDSPRPVKRRRLSDSQDKPKPLSQSSPRKPTQHQTTKSDAIHDQASPPKNSPSKTVPIPDSDAEDGDEEIDPDEPPSTQRTDIEQALPPIKTDREAIQEYEALRAAEAASDVEKRLGTREWVQGKSSIYVDAFNLALETVLEEESHLFDQAEMRVFEEWRALSYEGQYLYVRLFLRKTAAWFRISRLGYYSDIGDMEKAVAELFKTRELPHPSEEAQTNPGELAPPEGSVLGESFTFADSSDEHITTLEEASTLLLLDELKALAKDARVQGKNKSELLKALRRTSGKQTALGFGALKRSDTEESYESAGSESREDSPSCNNRDEHYLKKIMAETGQCIRLSPAPLRLFERVHLVFYRSTQWTENSLTTIILARIARRNFPEYIVSRSANIFSSRPLLLEFEASVRTQFRLDSILEFNGTPTKDGLQHILDIFEEVYPRWQVLVRDEQQKEDSTYSSGEGAYLRRLSPAWVYTRIVHKGAYVMGIGKFKHHAQEHEILSELLGQRLFHHSRRGAWYQRKALLEEHYKGELTSPDGRTPEQQKKHWKRVALRTCEEGLQDNLVHLIYHHDLQKRVVKLERQLRIPKSEQHHFGHALLAKPVERTFHGIRLERPPPSKPKAPPLPISQRRLSHPSTEDTDPTLPIRRGAKTIWIDPASPSDTTTTTENIVSVEAMCLSHYRAFGWRGYHTESGVLRTLFALLFYDILFLYLPNVFQTAFQTCPLDLHTDAFYTSRLSEINARLAEVSNGDAERIVGEVWGRECERRTCVVGLDWGFDVRDLKGICRAFRGERLAAVLRVMAQEYGERGGGVPDLFLWREGRGSGSQGREGDTALDGEEAPAHDDMMDKKDYDDDDGPDVLFAEVKSENDRLSDTQRLWIDVLMDSGVRVELCNALAKEVRVLDA